MRKIARSLVWSVAVFGFAKAADAHEFICEKTVNGGASVEVTSYPTTLQFEFKVINSHPTHPSIYQSVSDPMLSGFTFTPAGPHEVPVGGSVTDTFDVTLASAEECRDLAASDGIADDVLMNTLTVTWHGGQASCSASVTCAPPPPPPPPPPPEGGATRTPGFFKTHVQALEACMAEGSIDLGFVQIESVEQALGLLWGVPSKFTGSGIKRSSLDRARFILGRHTLVGVCNMRLFDTAPSPADLLSDAVAALAGTDCALMRQLAEEVDAFNNSGTEEPFPEGFSAGPATPIDAWLMNTDPTSPSGQVCK
jgi:hypothetical protein